MLGRPEFRPYASAAFVNVTYITLHRYSREWPAFGSIHVRPASQFSTAEALFKPGGIDPLKAAVLEGDVQPLIDERLEGGVTL